MECRLTHRDGSLCAPATLLARADEVIE